MDKKLTISAFHTAYLKIFTVAKPIIYLRRHILRIPILRKKKITTFPIPKKKKITIFPMESSHRKSAVPDADLMPTVLP